MKILLTTLLFVASMTHGKAQQLQNTLWTVTDTADVFYIYFNFSTDTLSYSYDGIAFTNIATYIENGNNYTMVDLASGPCPGDTGAYTFIVQNDSLFFTVVQDSCPTRPLIFQDYNWFIPNAGLKNNSTLEVSVFPNPSSEILQVQITDDVLSANYFVTDLSGKIVLSGRIIESTTEIEIGSLLSGAYFLMIDSIPTPIRFVKE